MNKSTLKELRNMLSASDINVIRQCEKFVDEKANLERMRGDAAERRVNIILGTLGASTAILIFIASTLLGSTNDSALIVLLYAFATLWVSRSVWYCVKSIRPQSRHQISVETVFEFQEKSEIDVLKHIISGKVWELQKAIQPNSARLFYAQRAQRALIVFVGILLLLGVLVMIQKYYPFQPKPCFLGISAGIGIAYWLFGDYLIEKAGIWNHT